MHVAVVGAGVLGMSLVKRLCTVPFVHELDWFNRSTDKMHARRIDLEHGLAFAPACRSVATWDLGRLGELVSRADAVVVTIGRAVKPGEDREVLYPDNREMLKTSVVAALRACEYRGIVLIVSNPVDALTRYVWKNSGMPDSRVFGLGTMVETARLQKSLSSHVGTRPSDIWAYALGTHDPEFIPVLGRPIAPGVELTEKRRKRLLRLARAEVAEGASRVRAVSGDPNESTDFPIIEAVTYVLGCVGEDRRALCTVSTRDPDSDGDLFYSYPCVVGADGASRWPAECAFSGRVETELEQMRDRLALFLKRHGDL